MAARLGSKEVYRKYAARPSRSCTVVHHQFGRFYGRLAVRSAVGTANMAVALELLRAQRSLYRAHIVTSHEVVSAGKTPETRTSVYASSAVTALVADAMFGDHPP